MNAKKHARKAGKVGIAFAICTFRKVEWKRLKNGKLGKNGESLLVNLATMGLLLKSNCDSKAVVFCWI